MHQISVDHYPIWKLFVFGTIIQYIIYNISLLNIIYQYSIYYMLLTGKPVGGCCCLWNPLLWCCKSDFFIFHDCDAMNSQTVLWCALNLMILWSSHFSYSLGGRCMSGLVKVWVVGGVKNTNIQNSMDALSNPISFALRISKQFLFLF